MTDYAATPRRQSFPPLAVVNFLVYLVHPPVEVLRDLAKEIREAFIPELYDHQCKQCHAVYNGTHECPQQLTGECLDCNCEQNVTHSLRCEGCAGRSLANVRLKRNRSAGPLPPAVVRRWYARHTYLTDPAERPAVVASVTPSRSRGALVSFQRRG